MNAQRPSENREVEFLSKDSAEWYIEAALNYSYTNTGKHYSEQLVDAISISVPIVSGGVQQTDAAQAYAQLGLSVNTANIDGESHVALVDVYTKEIDGALEVNAVRVVGRGSGSGGGLNTNYGSNDYWYHMNLGNPTSCGCSISSGPGQCANKQIQNRVNYAINGGYYQYYTDIETWTVAPGEMDVPEDFFISAISYPSPISVDNPVFGDGIRDYMTFIGNTTCLDPTDMRFYTQSAWDLMMQIKSLYVTGKTPASCTIEGDILCGCNGGYVHFVYYRYGKLAKTL